MTLDEQVARLTEALPDNCYVYDGQHGSHITERRWHDPVCCCMWYTYLQDWEPLFWVTQERATGLWTVALEDDSYRFSTPVFEEAVAFVVRHWPIVYNRELNLMQREDEEEAHSDRADG